MTQFSYNEKCILKDNKPWFPIMGEIHYSRCPKKYWKETLYKMKAGGVDVISSYVIWIHHEEIENEYDFEDNRDLRAFVACCNECGLYLVLRIGPWSHGEVRNGGFPDWLLTKEFEARTNNDAYFAEVKKFYQVIFNQIRGYLIRDGGPIIGVQIENEYGHCGGLSGQEGDRHMRTLAAMAGEIGFDVPLYTATGWGGAMTGGLLPVMGGYCEAPWDQRITDIEPSGNYVFTYERNDKNIGSDYGIDHGITFDTDKFPYLTAELGGGLQVTQHRRPVAFAEDIGAMSMVKLGSGVNLLGYYMYCGGTNPKGKRTTLQESKATGYSNDVPEMSYDFRAPIREYGQISDTFKEIKLLAMFIKYFGEELCGMAAYIPRSNPLQPDNYVDLRSSVRHDGESGYVFVNNYVRRKRMAEHLCVELQVQLASERITFAPINIWNQDYYFFPFNMKIGNAVLKTALATPLCILNGNTYVFYSDRDPQYDIIGDLGTATIITISREQAKNAYVIHRDKEYLVISNSTVIETDEEVIIFSGNKLLLKVYPDFEEPPEGLNRIEKEGEFAVYEKKIADHHPHVSFELIEKNEERAAYEINLDYPNRVDDCFIRIHYGGDSGKLYLGEEEIGDNFYTGQGWEIGLKQFLMPAKLRVEIFPLYEDDEIFLETWPKMSEGKACEITQIEISPEYQSYLYAPEA